MKCGWTITFKKNSEIITFISKNLFSLKALKMLYYVLIENSEGIDESEGLDVVSTTELKSKNCITCRFYYYCSKNFRYEKMSVMVVIIV